jgi:hypothetical protein
MLLSSGLKNQAETTVSGISLLVASVTFFASLSTEYVLPIPGSKNKPRKWSEIGHGTRNTRLAVNLSGFCLACSLTLKLEAICSSETSVNFHRTIRDYVT